MDCSAHTSLLLSQVADLPLDLIQIILNGSNASFLTAIASTALNPRRTDAFFTYLEPLFAEICARWVSSQDFSNVLPALARIVPFAPHLAEYVEAFLGCSHMDGGLLEDLPDSRPTPDFWTRFPEDVILESLLGLFRLLVFDEKTFAPKFNLALLEEGLSHVSRPIRYLTIRVLCLLLNAADAAMEDMIAKYLGTEAIYGVWESKSIDFRFLSLWEEKRYKDMVRQMKLNLNTASVDKKRNSRTLQQADLSSTTMELCGILVPRLGGAPLSSSSGNLVPTPSTVENIRSFAKAILQPHPVLLTGLAGSGKTTVVNHCAQQLNKLESMVTLHLNEQSDAKLLVGMYTSGSTPGTFTWRPGALTTAVKEGRWVFVEDLDRAPNEIISTLLPLIEHGKLLIPSRGEVIRAARGFKIIATMRTHLDIRGNEALPRRHMIGTRFWRQIPVKTLHERELSEIISVNYPQLRPHIPKVCSVYSHLIRSSQGATSASMIKTGLARPISPRDLFKWCSRISSGMHTDAEFSDHLLDLMFLESVDCFVAYVPAGDVFQSLVAPIAEELHIDTLRREYLLHNRKLQLSIAGGTLSIGRAGNRISRQRGRVGQRFFANSPLTLRLLEQLSVAVERNEPMLLVGETGIGKTTCVQQLAAQLGKPLMIFNLSTQSESGDLLGGFKPVNVRGLIMPLKDEFDELFHHAMSPFNKQSDEHQRFADMLAKAIAKGQWRKVCLMWKSALSGIERKYKKSVAPISRSRFEDSQHPRKKQRTHPNGTTGDSDTNFYQARWMKFSADVADLDAQLASKSDAFAFKFVEGTLVKAVRRGDWVLLDEINLATTDTLEALVDLLGGSSSRAPSLLMTETGKLERITAHPDFRIFAAMNPATDVGKRDLPLGIRSRFTEIYVNSPDRDMESLLSIVGSYLPDDLGRQLVGDVTNLYRETQSLSDSNSLVDGAGQKPHFSLRSLTRTLTYARDVAAPVGAKDGVFRRALYEGFHMSFSTLLDSASENILAPRILHHLFGKHANARSELNKPLPRPNDDGIYVQEGHYWIRKGAQDVKEQPHYIITPFVRRNLDNLIRAVSTRKLPILIQGPTSSGKTSMIEYLAKKSGNKFVRINNHEHTDLQEYLGTYTSGVDGKLHFQEGILVEALRKGYWIVLDELNLAPSDVLEALNRLLDDNRELQIPETQETVIPHPDFMLFATQNPAGLYGGRKHLSRAFRNRFLELHFGDIPVDDLCDILYQRTQIPRSWSQRIVDTYNELSNLRQENRMFEQKSFATLRDLFRWALRKADTVEQLGLNGFMLLAERVRKPEERDKVKEVIETVLSRKGPRVRIDEHALYSSINSPQIEVYQSKIRSHGVVWTKSMKRLFILVAQALRNNEPVLLVGETGCGKTTVCQMLADTFGKELFIVNAHQNTETGDLIGSQRPIRNRAAVEQQLRNQLIPILQCARSSENLSDDSVPSLLQAFDALGGPCSSSLPVAARREIQMLRVKLEALFEWSDGSLVNAMKSGQLFLLDEISLADDSVLERLNSVLEPQRSLLLAEKGPVDSSITAKDGFQFLATMNPGGDYGKKELSPALRNRFTEIWVPSFYDIEDVLEIVKAKLCSSAVIYSEAIVSFSYWFNQTFNNSATSAISIRDTLAWIEFVNKFNTPDPIIAIMHGACMVYIETLGANPSAMLSIAPSAVDAERENCIVELGRLLNVDLMTLYSCAPELSKSGLRLGIGPFYVTCDDAQAEDPNFTLNAPTTRSNAMRIFRALQLSKPILIEGNPGVGKTTLVSAIAQMIGKRLVRINLSEQTDLMDLFGSDVPVEEAYVGSFMWRDAPFLTAMKNGDWVLLDEMNLASQSVLEGLNACLDHRAEAYIAELDQTFQRHPNFRLFAAQNPHHQGGGRKGLPASFVNRFTVVYADILRPVDLLVICKQVYPNVADDQINTLTRFVIQLDTDVTHSHRFGLQGSPWEFNLRDTLRWLRLLTSQRGRLPSGRPHDFCDSIFRQRFRNIADRLSVDALFKSVFNSLPQHRSFYHNLANCSYQVGLGLMDRNYMTTSAGTTQLKLSTTHLPVVESLMMCVQENWPAILVGPSGVGKSTVIQHLAAVTGANLVSFPMNADIDSMDLVGGYEQADPFRKVTTVLSEIIAFSQERTISALLRETTREQYMSILRLAQSISLSSGPSKGDMLRLHTALLQLDDEESHELTELANRLGALASQPYLVEKAQFEWIDGLLVQTLERGDWLVLDNANLCSSSVLDRLNSLLEPNGYLSINEHPLENGDARLIKPHPNFRIFLTMDPRNGELSRAMRNRAIELCMIPEAHLDVDDLGDNVSFALESAMYRYRNFMAFKLVDPDLGDVVADHISFQDLSLQARFQEQISQGLVGDMPSQFHDSLSMLSRVDGTWFSKNLDLVGKDQSIHPLNNELFCRNHAQFSPRARWLSEAYDTFLDLSKMKEAINGARRRSTESRVLSRFGRSVNLERFPKAVKESTAQVAPFLEESLSCMQEYASGLVKREDFSMGDLSSLKLMRTFWWELLLLVDSPDMEEATFQTYLNLAEAKFRRAPAQGLLKSQLMRLERMVTASGLSTGKSMEPIWKKFRPETVSDMDRLNSLIRLESLADRFDSQIFPLRSPLDELCRIRATFIQAIRSTITEDVDTSVLAKDLEAVIAGLEKSSPTIVDKVARPFFAREFETISQYFAFVDLRSSGREMGHVRLLLGYASIFAQRSTKQGAMCAWQSDTLSAANRLLLSVDAYSSQSINGVDDSQAVRQDLQISLGARLRASHSVSLGQVEQFRIELDVLAQLLAVGSKVICANQDEVLERTLKGLLNEIEGVSSESSELQMLLQDTTLSGVVSMQVVADDSSINRQALSRCWIQFALACIFAYVPDRPFDPALKHSTQRQLLADRKAKVSRKLQALELFESTFSGQKRNLRYNILSDELDGMGADIPELQIPRPSTSQLNGLQGWFNIVLQIAKNVQADYLLKDHVFDTSIRQNINQIIARLREGYRAYDDIIVPLVGFLQCLIIGIVLSETSSPSDGKLNHEGALKELRTLQLSNLRMSTSSEKLDDSLYRLSLFSVVRNVEKGEAPFRFFPETHQIFSQLYSAWKGKISAEQEKFAKKSSLYAYRGGQDAEDEDDEDEFQSMFPDYEQADGTVTSIEGTRAPRDAAVLISTIHAHIFCGVSDPHDLLVKLLREVNTGMQNQRTTTSEATVAGTLPYLFFEMQNKIQTLDSGSTMDTNYNIYTDPNVAEAKKLAALVIKIQSHSRSLLSFEFEHSTIDDMIRIGDEILAFEHTEPIAKFMTKTEKLHDTMNEWERIAHKGISASILYTDLTNLIVSWRRLELSTWMRLYDLEMAKCVDDAKSWWFVAYETIIAVPESLVLAGQPLKLHAQELLKTLESFFTSTSMGQYQERLRLVIQFQNHLEHIVDQSPELELILTSVANFVAYFSRFESPVSDALANGRLKLEKDIKEVVQLASWKDTNIASLKQSARTSHRKLFKLVRKFRELLNRPVTSIVEEGPPDEIGAGHDNVDELVGALVDVSDAKEALVICGEFFSDWANIPSRFKNTFTTISLMHKIGYGPNATWNGTVHIHDFLSKLRAEIVELQKATPTILNDETKSKIKQLKTEKRRLFAYALKQLRLMGFQYNLSSDVLSKQDSTALILASLPTITAQNEQFPMLRNAEFHFHKTLSVMNQVRKIQRKHSADLTPAEVARSTGFLESILQRILLQRRQIASTVDDFTNLKIVLNSVANLCLSTHPLRNSETDGTHDQQCTTMKRSLSWLKAMTKLFMQIVSVQCHLGKIEASTILEKFDLWVMKLDTIVSDFDKLPHLPSKLHTILHENAINQSRETILSLRTDIQSWIDQFPMLQPVLDQLMLWTHPESSPPNGNLGLATKEISEVRESIFSTVDVLLGSIQDLDRVTNSFANSTEENDWLNKEGTNRVAALTSFRTRSVTATLLSSADTLSSLPERDLEIAKFLLSAVLPIIQQYIDILQGHITSFVGFHDSICKLSHHLSVSFIQIGTKGFCTPPDKASNNEGQDDKLEGGTGLGEGEGAEDISKDIGEDEDLTELAQEPNKNDDRDEIEDERDAVDMADEDMEGEMGEVPEKGEDEEGNGSGDEEDGDEEMEEEAGGVDDLGPSTVDEKMWDDGEKKDDVKAKEDEQGKGSKQDEQAAAQDGNKEDGNDQEETAEQDDGADESEDVGEEQMEKTDQNLEQGNTLDLPEDLDMEGNTTDKSDGESLGDLDDLDDGNVPEGTQLDEDFTNPEEDGSNDKDDDIMEDKEIGDDTDTAAEADDLDKTDQLEDGEEVDMEKDGVMDAYDDEANPADDAAPSNPQGVGLDHNKQQDDLTNSKSAAQQEEGENGEETSNNQGVEGQQGANGDSENQEAVGRSDDVQDSAESQSFKKLGDTLERWYNQQRQIRQPRGKSDAAERVQKRDVDMADVDFEHLLNEESQAEAQALGAASEDQARALNDENAIPTNETEAPQNSFEEETQDVLDDMDEDVEMENADPLPDRRVEEKQDGQVNAFIGEAQSQSKRENETGDREADSEQELEDVDIQLSDIHLTSNEPSSDSYAIARGLWTKHELSTRTLAATLTEQLRLILAPTMATKLRGHFRTGKRLNIKRIIPYIASSYKRDKIWMRRSVPSKRAYQIMIALDDSKSMAEGGSKELAFETLALISKALSMLESGELCIVGFGEDVKIAHAFDKPFTDDAGVQVLSKLTFEQEKTDVRKLVADGIELFKEARAKASSSTAELWQLMLVVSDAICDDADAIRRLVRKSQEEKIMIVFVVVDAACARDSAVDGRKGQSIMDLEKVEFRPDGNGELKVMRFKYMQDVFPFKWWIVVRDVRELPAVLATALRQWFAEVVESRG